MRWIIIVILGLATLMPWATLHAEPTALPAAEEQALPEKSHPASNGPERAIWFSNLEWRVKSSSEPVGPGPNYFSSSADNVWVDKEGRLHLKIGYQQERWWAAEVISKASFGYGTYRFVLDTNFDTFDPQAVLGMFTWDEDPSSPFNRELDMEIAKWGDVKNKAGQCVVQPYSTPQNIVRFALPSGLTSSVHILEWSPGKLVCKTVGASAEVPQALIREHTFTTSIPRPGTENARINLWLVWGNRPQSDHDIEVVVRRFEFLPLQQQQ